MKQLVRGALIALTVTILAGIGYYYFQQYSLIIADPTDAIAGDAAIILEFKGGPALTEKLKRSTLWNKVCNDPSIGALNRLLLETDSFFKPDAPAMELWSTKNILMSYHPTGNLTGDWLWSTDLPAGTNESKASSITERLLKTGTWITREFENVKLHELLRNDSTQFCYAVDKGIYFCSRSSILVENTIRHLKNGIALRKQKNFSALYSPVKTNGVVRAYFNLAGLKELWSGKSTAAGQHFFRIAGSTTGWIGGELHGDQSGINLEGMTSPGENSNLLATVHPGTTPPEALLDLLPQQTAWFTWFPFDSLSQTWKQLRKNPGLFAVEQQRNAEVRALFERIKTSVPETLLDSVSGECCVFITEPVSTSLENNIFIALHVNANSTFPGRLRELSQQLHLNPSPTTSTGPHCYPLSDENLSALWFGELASGMRKTAVGIYGQTILLGGQSAALQGLLEKPTGGKLLNEASLKMAVRKCGTKSVLISYVDCSRAQQLIRTVFDSTTAASLGRSNSWIRNFGTALCCISSENTKLLTSIRLNATSTAVKPAMLSWATELDTALETVPTIIYTDPEHESAIITAQDAKHQLYLIQPSGSIRIKKPLPDAIAGKIAPVDIFNNNTIQLLFATRKQLWVIDEDGNNAGNFPLSLPASAAGDACFHYDANGLVDKIYVPCTNGFIYAYEKDGRPAEKWQQRTRIDSLSSNLQTVQGDSPCKLLVHANSTLLLLNENGKPLAFPSIQRFRSAVTVSNDTSSAVVLVNAAGDLLLLDLHKMALSTLQSGDSIRQIISSDWHNVIGTIISASKNRITVRDVAGSSLFEIDLPEFDFKLIQASSSKSRWGVTDNKKNKLYLYDIQGRLLPGFPITGAAGFDFLESGRYTGEGVVTGSADGTISLFTIEE